MTPKFSVNGQTEVYGVIGDPISHTFSPQIHRYFAEIAGRNLTYVPFPVKNEQLRSAIAGARALGIRGLNVTIPHKRAVMPFLSRIDDKAVKIGSVNTLVEDDDGYAGYNTDHIGISRTLAAMKLSFEGRPVIVFGAGGSAYAACVAALDGGASGVAVVNRTPENATILAAHIKSFYNIDIQLYSFNDIPNAGNNTVVIQTTTLGFGAQVGLSPVANPSFFEGAALAFDIVYTPWETAFLQQARAAGIPAVNGFPMLVYQAAASFILWNRAEEVPTDAELTEASHLEVLASCYRRLHAD